MNLSRIIEIQKKLSKKLNFKKVNYVKFIVGVDVAYNRNDAYCSCCLFQLPEFKLIDEVILKSKVNFPYLSSFLSFREGPIIVKCVRKLNKKPDVILVDGHGIAHHRKFGLACFVGYALNLPTIGCSKENLFGEYKEPGNEFGQFSYLFYNNEIIGCALRTKKKTKVIFVSQGNLIDLHSSIKIVLSVCKGYRIPEPLRIAHINSKKKVKGCE